jgi:hypothetical protein
MPGDSRGQESPDPGAETRSVPIYRATPYPDIRWVMGRTPTSYPEAVLSAVVTAPEAFLGAENEPNFSLLKITALL